MSISKAQQGDVRSLRLLLRRGADRSQATSRGRSALDLARLLVSIK